MHPVRLGSYLLEAQLGRGGMGVVYRARQSETGERVAVKVLSAELTQASHYVDRFDREIAVLQRLDHCNIVRLIDFGDEAGQRYYVMELVDGTSLDQEIDRHRRIAWDRTVQLAIQVCSGLKHAHDHGVIHRDLKPANLLITSDDQVKLGDFGIAKLFAATQLTATGRIIGTAAFMSPEQAQGKPVSRRSDLYSLGTVLYAMLTGRPPFVGRSQTELLQMHRYGQFDEPRALVPEIPSWLNELVRQLLEKDPGKRPPDAYVVRRRLEAIQKKVQLRASGTGETLTTRVEVEADSAEGPGRPGPTTLIQRLVSAHLQQAARPTWPGRLFQKTWVLVLALLLSVAAITSLSLVGKEKREKRRWATISRLAASGDERDLGMLERRLLEYKDRHPDGPHAADARAMLRQVERDRRRRQFVRSPVIGQLRPPPEPPSELERLYRKALLQLWTEGEEAARATLEAIVARGDAAEEEQFLVDLAQEDLLSLQLQQVENLRREGRSQEAREICQRIIEQHRDTPRYRRYVTDADRVLTELERER